MTICHQVSSLLLGFAKEESYLTQHIQHGGLWLSSCMAEVILDQITQYQSYNSPTGKT